MSFKIRYTPKAQADIESVWNDVYEASKSYDCSDKYVDDLLDVISKKRNFPNSGIPLVYRGLFTGFYSVNFKSYKAFYRIKDNYIEIIRVILAKRDYLQIIFNDNGENRDDCFRP